MNYAFALVRGLHLGSLMVLFGSAVLLFRLRGKVPELAIESGALRRLRLLAAATALLSAIVWFGFTAVQMSGDMTTLSDPKALRLVLQSSLFGQVFIARLVALALLCAAVAIRWEGLTALVSGVALVLISVTSHAAAASPNHFTAIGIVFDGLHLLCGGIWLGSLAVLAAIMAERRAAPRLGAGLSLFATWGIVAVALLVMTGIIDGASIVLGMPGRASTLYLGVLGAKFVLVLAMTALALSNHLRLMPQLSSPVARPEASAILKGNIAWELILGCIVVVLAGLLGLLEPTVMS